MKNLLLALLVLVLAMVGTAMAKEINICQNNNTDGLRFAPGNNPERCAPNETLVTLYSDKPELPKSSIPAEFDRVFIEYTNTMPNPPDPWYCSDGTFQLIKHDDGSFWWTFGLDTLHWSSGRGWVAIHYYKCIPGSGESCP